jgi:hypothetical protein
MSNSARLSTLLLAIDQVNSRDPNREEIDGQELPKELVYGQRMSARLAVFCPGASEHLQIAARAQHIERWTIARSLYPLGRTGYKKWRSQLSLFHAQRTGELMAEHGYSQDDIDRVRFLMQKRQLHRDTETQTLEDVVCLVFIEYYLADFAEKHPKDKLIDIIQKTWKKISAEGQAAVLQLALPQELTVILREAVL